MKKALKVLAVAAAIAVSGSVAASAEALKVGVAAEPYPPFTAPDASGKWEGWEVEFMNAMCAEAQLECVLTPVAWDGIIPALTSKKIDMIISSMSITDERLKTIDFSDKYYNTPTGIIGTKGEDIKPTPEGLNGKTLGVQVSTVHQAYAAKHFAPAGVEVKEYGKAMSSDASPLRADVVAAVTRAVQKLHPGVPVVPDQASGATDGLVFRAAGIPTYGVGGVFMRSKDDFSHGLNERIPVEGFYSSLDYWYLLLKDLAGRR